MRCKMADAILKSHNLPNYVILHSVGVADFLADYVKTHYPEENAVDYYVMGLLHDVGKFDMIADKKSYGFKGHAERGGNILEHLGFVFAKEIKHHGHPEDAYYSRKLLLLNLADLSVNGKGEVISIKERLEDIAFRYGQESSEYKHALKIVAKLKDEGFIDEAYQVL